MRITQISFLLVLISILEVGRCAGVLQSTSPSRIRVEPGNHGFVDAAGAPFVPFGVTYYRPNTGWAPQVWTQFDAQATRRDFALLKKHGVNVVRVFISFGSFWKEAGALDSGGLAKFDRFLDLADEAGLYVHPTGPDRWEGMPAWTNGLSMSQPDGDPRCLDALSRYWRMFAERYHGRSTIWAYDLRNEPDVAWNGEGMRAAWNAWRNSRGEQPIQTPDESAPPSAGALLEFQHFREHVAEEWVTRQADAIHAADPGALVSIGLIQSSIPAQRMSISHYSGFRPAAIARHLDFMELHYYPLATGPYRYQSLTAETTNLSVLESMAREAANPGLPLVISEFGWAGGGEFAGASCTEAQQEQWCRRLVEVTSPLSCGWLNWGMYDHPEAQDVTKLTGLFTAGGKEKAWGASFSRLAARFRESPPQFAPLGDRPDLPWDRCIVSGEAMEQFRQTYLKAFSASASHKP